MIESGGQPRDGAQDLEQWLIHAVEQLPGVLAAAVWLAEPHKLRALHITAAPHASGAIITNAAAQILRKMGLEFRMDMIRIAHRDDPPAKPPVQQVAPTTSTGRFLLLQDLTVTRSGSRVTCQVVVARDADTFDGEAIELDTEAGRVRAAARATLAAAERAGEQVALGLEGTALVEMFGRRYVAASVEAAVERRFAVLAGLVPVDPARSPEEAACLAALRAVDRWISW
jgi:hypothetical protein